MQTRMTSAISAYSCGLFWVLGSACGGGQAAVGSAQSAEATPAPSSGVEDAGVPHESATTTSALVLGDAGELQGVKLAEVHPASSAPLAASAPPKGGHSHDPGRGPTDIRAIIVSHRDAARACYDKGLANHPGVEGTLTIQWTIDPKGNVTQTSLDPEHSQIAEPAIVGCISDIIKKIQFAPSQGGFESMASYPFTFHPHGAAHHNAE
jgi:hypothetical protein